jgi:hypothetical protein
LSECVNFFYFASPVDLEIKGDMMGGTYLTHEGNEKCVQNFRLNNGKGRDQLRNLEVDGR